MKTLALAQQQLLALLTEAGVQQKQAFLRLADRFELTTDDALALASTKGQPAKIAKLLEEQFKPAQVVAIYEVSDEYGQDDGRVPLNLLGKFAYHFLGLEFTDNDLHEAMEAAIRISGEREDGQYPMSSQLSYTLGIAQGLKTRDLDVVENFAPTDGFGTKWLETDEGQGDIGD